MPTVLVELFPEEIELLGLEGLNGLDDQDEQAIETILRLRLGLPAETDKPDTEACEG